MDLIQWKDEYSVGVPEMDKQHKGLIVLINRLTEEEQTTGMIAYVFEALDQYVKEHFRAEEKLMRASGYADLEPHKRQHRDFEEWLRAVKQAHAAGASTFMLAETVNEFLRRWLIDHILKTDMAYKPVLAHATRQRTPNA
jgi:hemerythrin